MRLLRPGHFYRSLCTLTISVFLFNQIVLLYLCFLVSPSQSSSSLAIIKQPSSPIDSSSDLFFSDSNDRNTVHSTNQPPGTGDQQVIYINHGNGAISSIRRSLRQKIAKLPFNPHVTSYPSSLFDNPNSDINLEPVPLVDNYELTGNSPPEGSFTPINPSRIEGEVDLPPPPPPPPVPAAPNRRPSRRSTPTDNNKPSRIIYDPQPSSLTPPSQPSQPPPSSLSTLNPGPSPPPVTHRPSRVSDPFIPFNLDNIFARDPTFDIERNVIGSNIGRGNQDNSPPSSHRNHRFQNENVNNINASPLPLHGSQPSRSPVGENDLNNHLNKPELVKITEDDRTSTIEPRVRKQITNTGPPSAYSGRPQLTTPSPPNPILGTIGPTGFGPSLGSEDGFIPSYGPPGFGLPGGQDIFPFFETPFLPISNNGGRQTPHGFQRRRLTNNHHNNLGAYGNPDHHISSSPPPPPPPVNNVNDNSLGNGYPSYTIYKGGDDEDAGVKWPKIFKFTDGRVNLSEFERNKKSGKIKFLNKEDAHFGDVRRDSFLILHGGAYN